MLEGLHSLLSVIGNLQPAFTQPSFANLMVLFAGWVRTTGAHAVTEALVITEVAGHRHHEAFHRFFSRGTWDPDEVGRLLFHMIIKLLPGNSPIRVAVDDTLAPKKGPHVHGIGNHIDPVRSTKRYKVFSFGHCWVVLAVLIAVPFSTRTWALPVLFRLYRQKKECESKAESHSKKTELARQMIDVFLGWVGARPVEVTADQAYCNNTVMSGLPRSVVFFGSMRHDAVLTAPPPKRKGKQGGRPRVRGELLPKPEALAKDERQPWETCEANLYGVLQKVQYKCYEGQWYRACGALLLRIVVTQVQQGSIGIRVFFCTDPTRSVQQILEGYSERWGIEVCFRDLKQLLGFADSPARKRKAVERVAHL